MILKKTDKKTLVKQFSRHEKDTGSAEVQIAVMSQRIAHLTEHFTQFKKDNNSKRGLMRLIGRRKRLMRYLERTNPENYKALMKKLGLKKTTAAVEAETEK
jgi:small subunit ribosomal protein S15